MAAQWATVVPPLHIFLATGGTLLHVQPSPLPVLLRPGCTDLLAYLRRAQAVGDVGVTMIQPMALRRVDTAWRQMPELADGRALSPTIVQDCRDTLLTQTRRQARAVYAKRLADSLAEGSVDGTAAAEDISTEAFRAYRELIIWPEEAPSPGVDPAMVLRLPKMSLDINSRRTVALDADADGHVLRSLRLFLDECHADRDAPVRRLMDESPVVDATFPFGSDAAPHFFIAKDAAPVVPPAPEY